MNRFTKKQRDKAEFFRCLHARPGKILVLPNAWDVASARQFEEEGFPAVATSSAGMMVSHGFSDGEDMGRRNFLSIVRKIAETLTVPLTVDSLSGFGATPNEVRVTTVRLIRAGAIGLNIEDYNHRTKTLLSLESQVAKLKAIRSAAAKLEIPLVINARTDALRFAVGSEEERFSEAIRRSKAYRDAGADCVYPMGLVNGNRIGEFVKALQNFPVNVMIRKGLPGVAELEHMGVARVSFGPSASYAAMALLKRVSKEIHERGTFSLLTEGVISYDELDRLGQIARASS